MEKKENSKLNLINGLKYVKKAPKFVWDIVKYPLLIGFIIIFILYLPDIFLHIRYKLNEVSFVKKYIAIFDIKNNTSQYILMIISIITCVITGILSVLAYKLSKRLGNVQLSSQEMKQALAAQNLIRNIEENCGVIYDTIRGTANEKNIVYIKELNEDWTFLYKTGAIEKEEKNFLIKYNEKIANIVEYVNKGDERAKNIVNKFAEEYFVKPERLTYKGELEDTIKKLEEIDERRNENV